MLMIKAELEVIIQKLYDRMDSLEIIGNVDGAQEIQSIIKELEELL